MKECTSITKAEVIAALALAIGGSIAALYSEAMQKDLELYYQLVRTLFHIGFQPELALRFANVALTNLGDLATPVAAVGAYASLMVALGSKKNEVAMAGMLSGVIASLYYIFSEISYMAPNMGTS